MSTKLSTEMSILNYYKCLKYDKGYNNSSEQYKIFAVHNLAGFFDSLMLKSA